MSGNKFKVEVVPISKTYLGEGPHWDEKKQELFFVDITKSAVHRYVPATGEEYKVVVDEGTPGFLSFVIPIESEPTKYLVGLERSIRVLEWDGKSSTSVKSADLKILHQFDEGRVPIRFNDGKCDNKGRLWTGSMGINWQVDKNEGKLYLLSTNGELSKHVDNIGLSNGLAWSADNKTFYYIDTWVEGVDAFDYDISTGKISNRRTIFDFKTNNINGLPDGMCIDVEGNLWVAVYGGSKVIHINPTNGKLLDWIDLPAKNITSVAFGGPKLEDLYVTCAQVGLDDEEIELTSAGAIFKVSNTGTRGLTAGVAFGGKI